MQRNYFQRSFVCLIRFRSQYEPIALVSIRGHSYEPPWLARASVLNSDGKREGYRTKGLNSIAAKPPNIVYIQATYVYVTFGSNIHHPTLVISHLLRCLGAPDCRICTCLSRSKARFARAHQVLTLLLRLLIFIITPCSKTLKSLPITPNSLPAPSAVSNW